jgi:hypothetical protein
MSYTVTGTLKNADGSTAGTLSGTVTMTPPPPIGPVASPDGTTTTVAATALLTNDLTSWHFTSAGIVEFMPNGSTTWAAAGFTASVTELCKQGNNIYQMGNGQWYQGSMSNSTTFGTWTGPVADPTGGGSVTPPTPPTGGFSISQTPVAMPTNGAVNVNLTSPTGMVVGPELWGVSQSSSGGGWGGSFANSGWVSAMAALDVRSWRLQGEGVVSSIFGGAGSVTPNWAPINPLVANLKRAFPNAKLMWTLVDPGMSGGYANANPTIFANQCVQLANYLESKGIHIDYFDIFNEPDGGSASAQQCQTMCAAVFPALAALNKGYKFGTSPTGPRGVIVSPYPADCIAGYPAMNYVSGHWYAGAADAGSTANNLACGIPNNGPFGQVSVGAETFNGKKYPFAMSEYAFGYNGGGSPSITGANTNMIASVTYAMMLANGAMTNVLWETGVWDGAQSIYGWTGNLSTMAPHCFMLAKGGQLMPGNIVATKTSLPLVVLATTSGLMIVNGNQTGSQVGSVVMAGLLNASLHKWQQVSTDQNGNFSNNAGTTTTIQASAMASQTFPPLSVTVYSP